MVDDETSVDELARQVAAFEPKATVEELLDLCCISVFAHMQRIEQDVFARFQGVLAKMAAAEAGSN